LLKELGFDKDKIRKIVEKFTGKIRSEKDDGKRKRKYSYAKQ